jgi:precorrin-6B methylase 1
MARQSKTMRGRPGDVARELLDGGHHAEVLALVEKLAAKNEELERIIASARVRNRSEVVPLGAARADPGGAAHHGGGCERG